MCEVPKEFTEPSSPTSSHPGDHSYGPPLPQRNWLQTCVEGDVSRADNLELQTRQECSPLGVGEGGQGQRKGVRGTPWVREEWIFLAWGQGASRVTPLRVQKAGRVDGRGVLRRHGREAAEARKVGVPGGR